MKNIRVIAHLWQCQNPLSSPKSLCNPIGPELYGKPRVILNTTTCICCFCSTFARHKPPIYLQNSQVSVLCTQVEGSFPRAVLLIDTGSQGDQVAHHQVLVLFCSKMQSSLRREEGQKVAVKGTNSFKTTMFFFK